MFTVDISYGSGGSFRLSQPVMADRLPEVERQALSMAARLFPDFTLVMVHEGDLQYAVYAVYDALCTITIKG